MARKYRRRRSRFHGIGRAPTRACGDYLALWMLRLYVVGGVFDIMMRRHDLPDAETLVAMGVEVGDEDTDVDEVDPDDIRAMMERRLGELEQRIEVFFEQAGKKSVLTRHAPLHRVSGPEADSPRLDNLHLPTDGASYDFRSLADMRAAFLEQFPEAFADARYIDEERSYKERAVAAVADSLSQQTLDAAIAAGKREEPAQCAVRTVQQTNLANRHEKTPLTNGLEAESAQPCFVLRFHCHDQSPSFYNSPNTSADPLIGRGPAYGPTPPFRIRRLYEQPTPLHRRRRP